MKHITLTIILLSGLITTSLAQTLTPRVICSGYGAGQGGGIKLNYTIGETFVTTLRSGNTVLTQGFHQPEITLCPSAPLVTNPAANITLECNYVVPQYDPGFYMENGTAVTTEVTSSETFDGCTRVITETYIGTNVCGDTTTVVRTITQVDSTSPVIEATWIERSFECSAAQIIWPSVTAVDNCFNAELTYTEETIPGDCISNYSIERTYTAFDACGNSSTLIVTAILIDSTAPIIDNLPEGGTLSCLGEINFDGVLVSDNCSEVTTSVSTVETHTSAGLVAVAEYQAVDACGNSSIASVMFVAPLGFPGSPCDDGLICTTNDVVDENCGCSGTLIDNDNNNVCDYVDGLSITASSLSFCLGEEITLSITNPIAGINYLWSNNQGGLSIAVSPTASASYSVSAIIDNQHFTASIQLNALPTYTFYPDADGDGLGDALSSITSCNEVVLGYVMNNSDCNDSDVNVYPGAACDDNNPCTVNDVIGADCTCAGTFADSDQDGVCNADDLCYGPEPGTSCNDNNPCTVNDIVGVDCVCAGTSADDDHDNICNALDPCLGVPIAANTPQNLSVSCNQEIPDFNPAFYMADGSEVFLTHTASVVNEGCQTRVIEVWTATNSCNESTSVYRTVTQTDDTAPVLEGIPADRTIACQSAENTLVYPTATDDCSATDISYTYERIDGDCPNNYTKHYVFTAVDACGNSSSEVYNVYVRDQIAPIIDTYGIDGRQISCIGEIANRPFTATDNCSDVSLSYSMIDYIVGSFHIVETTCQAVDACGNTSYEVIVDTTALGNVGSPCDDGLYCTTNDVVTADCNCVGSLIDNNGNYICDFIDNFTISVNSLSFCPGETITLAVSQPITDLNYFWSNNAIGTSIQVSPAQSTTYAVSAVIDGQTLHASVNLIALPVNVFYADNDGDGYGDIQDAVNSCQSTLLGYVMNSSDCSDSNANIFIGASCNDNDPCTANDIISADCTCAGTFADSDNDGTCDANDLCVGPEPGAACDDGDDCTINDTVQSDCTCVGTFVDTDEDGTCDAYDVCFGPEPGSRCEDGNPCTFNEKVTEDCACVGILYVPGVGQQTAFACGSYQWNGNTYTQSGDYEFHSPTATGCDSTTVLHLTIAQPTSSSSSASACGSYQWNGSTYTQSGTYTYLSTNAAGCQHTSILNLTINTLSTAPTAANASQTTVSAGASITLTVSGGALGTGAQWKWYKGSCGGTLVGTGASITTAVSATTTYYVRAEGTCNTTVCASVTVTVQTAVCGPQSVSASATTICSGSSTTLSVVGSTGTGGTWKWYKNGCGSGTAVGTGATLTVSPTANTTYYVRSEGGSCGITTCLSVVINVNALPAKPGEITGLSSGLCNRQSVVYSVGNCAGASSYQWTVPSGVTIISGQGTASITVNFSASIGTNNSCGSSSICVRSGNSCGWSAYQCLELRLAPTAPSSISGNSAPCRNQVNTYTIAAVSGATSYVWAVPSGCTIQSGQGTTSINVMVGSTSGNVTVTAVNACGQSTQANKSIRPKSCATAMPMLLELWPNPTSERVFFAHGENTPELLEIYDMLGRDIYRGQWIGEFDVTGLASGIYFVRATYAGESEVKRMEVVK